MHYPHWAFPECRRWGKPVFPITFINLSIHFKAQREHRGSAGANVLHLAFYFKKCALQIECLSICKNLSAWAKLSRFDRLKVFVLIHGCNIFCLGQGSRSYSVFLSFRVAFTQTPNYVHIHKCSNCLRYCIDTPSMTTSLLMLAVLCGKWPYQR